MTIQEYIEEISNSENLTLDQNTDLDSIVSKMEGFQFEVEELLQNNNLNTVLVSKIEQTLNLIFIHEELESNVCFANTDEVRAEYKQSFRLIDLLNYLYAFVHLPIYKEGQKISIPKDVSIFLKIVKFGSDLKNKKQ